MSDAATSHGPVRPAAVAGSFYPSSHERLDELVAALYEAASQLPGARSAAPAPPLGLLVPHAGLVYSGVPAAAGWATLPAPAARDDAGQDDAATGAATDDDAVAPGLTVVILGTNHGAGWLDGIGAWDRGPWVTPADLVQVDHALTTEVVALGEPFTADPAAHIGEHSIEVQLPLLAVASPGARIVALAVASGTGERAVEAGERLGRLLAARRHAGDTVVLAISSDMAHYPAAAACEAVTERLWPAIAAVDPVRLAREEAAVRDAGVAGIRGVACGMCGIEPAVLGLAALRAMGASRGTLLAASTSADAGGPPDRTVGYLAVRFDA
jgi:AmmeMemoRadiSam system protein B